MRSASGLAVLIPATLIFLLIAMIGAVFAAEALPWITLFALFAALPAGLIVWSAVDAFNPAAADRRSASFAQQRRALNANQGDGARFPPQRPAE